MTQAVSQNSLGIDPAQIREELMKAPEEVRTSGIITHLTKALESNKTQIADLTAQLGTRTTTIARLRSVVDRALTKALTDAELPDIKTAVTEAPEDVRDSTLVTLLVNTLTTQKKEAADAQAKLERRIKLLEAQVVVHLDVHFDVSKESFAVAGYESSLAKIVTYLQANPHIFVRLKGSTDKKGDPAKNKTLSEQRVQAVKSYFTGKGINPARFSLKFSRADRPVETRLSNPNFNNVLERIVAIRVDKAATQNALEEAVNIGFLAPN